MFRKRMRGRRGVRRGKDAYTRLIKAAEAAAAEPGNHKHERGGNLEMRATSPQEERLVE